MSTLQAPPYRASFVELDRGRPTTTISRDWLLYFQTVSGRAAASPSVLATVALTAQHAAIATTNLATGTLTAGVYRLSYYARIATPASINSSLTITLGWTDGGVAQSASGAAITGNTTTSYQSGAILVNVDAAAAITYATTYASNAAGMQYALSITVEQLS